MEVIWDSAVKRKIEPFNLGLGTINNVKVVENARGLDDTKDIVFNKVKNSYKIEEIKDVMIISLYRKFSWHYLNIDPTKTRPSGEALTRRVLKGQDIPIINNCVFAINLASIATKMSFSGFDLSKIQPPLHIRFGHKSEEFQGLGSRNRILTGTELLLADSEKILCIYAYGDANETRITTSTKNILLINYGVPNISAEILERGIQVGLNFIHKTAGGVIGEIMIS